MAKKHEQGTGNEFQLVKGVNAETGQPDKRHDNFELVVSRVQSMDNLEVANGDGTVEKRNVPREQLVKGVNEKTGAKIYRFQTQTAIPRCRRVSSISEIGDAVAEYLANIELYDRADAIRKSDGTLAQNAHKIKLSVNGKGEPMSVLEYFYSLIDDAPRLNAQRKMWKAISETAEATLREELGWAEPAKSVRVKKEKVEEGRDIEADL